MVTKTVTNRVIALFVLGAGSLVVAAPLRSQTEILVTPYVGAYFAHEDAVNVRPSAIAVGGESLDDAAIFGVRVGVPLRSNLILEGSYGFTTFDARIEMGGLITGRAETLEEHDSHIYGIALQLLLTPDLLVTPFLTGGVGAMTITSRVPDFPPGGDIIMPEDETETDLVVTAGTGIKAGVSGRVSLRVDARALFQYCDWGRYCRRGDETLRNAELTFGVQVEL